MKLFTTKNSSQGFTLIELLVVIGILGILAGTLFFTINPLEQLNRGNDAARKTAIEGFVNGANGFYATQRMFPWDPDGANCSSTGALTQNSLTSANGAACLGELIDAGELRQSFTQDAAVLDDIFVTAGVDSVIACFEPQSAAEQTNARYTQAGVEDLVNGTYWCIVQE